MKTLSFLLLSALAVTAAAPTARAQAYGNEWVEAGRTYLKIKVARTGLYRVPKAALDAAGMPAGTTGGAFKMFRNGEEVALLPSTAGALGSSDFIEFVGEPQDGSMDRELYVLPGHQPNDRKSLYNDTAVYFLTWDAGTTQHLRYTAVANNIPTAPGAPQPWVWSKSVQSFANVVAPGYSHAGSCSPSDGNFFYSSQYDDAEGLIHGYAGVGALPINFSTPYSVAAAVGARVRAGLVGISFPVGGNLHPMAVHVNNALVYDTTYGPNQTLRIAANAAAGAVLPATTEVRFTASPGGSCYYDQWGLAFAELEYPRAVNAGGADHFLFTLPAGAGQYLEVSNFNHGGAAPRLFDLTTRTVISGDISVSGLVRFLLPVGVGEREVLIVSASSNLIQPAAVAGTRQFTDWTAAGKQGAYLIVSHNRLMQGAGGSNPVEAYRAYRASAAGGGWSTTVADVEELTDQFGWGVTNHPLMLRRFFRYAHDTWTTKPTTVFLIGRGMTYRQQATYDALPAAQRFPIVPTWGHPGSDNDLVNFGPRYTMTMSIGRLSVWNPAEILTYLDKVTAYERAQATASFPTLETEGWKKLAVHIAGSSKLDQQQGFLLPNLDAGRRIIEDTQTGYRVTTIAKNNTNPVDPVTTPYMDSIMNRGQGLLTFHGHASSTGFDYNINDPERYNNKPRLPVFLGLGCDVADIFNRSITSTAPTISERYVRHGSGGSVAMLAMDNIGFASFHRNYLEVLYGVMAGRGYGNTLGQQCRMAYDSIVAQHPVPGSGGGLFTFAHLEAMILQGDPALRLYAPAQPDYHVSTTGLSTLPASVSTELDSFGLRIAAYNLGRAFSDTGVVVRVVHTNPQGATRTVATYTRTRLNYADTTVVYVPVDKTLDLGLNRYRVTIDADNRYAEGSEVNNEAVLELFIFSNDLVPVYPRPFAIVGAPSVTLKASSLNPFRAQSRFVMEMDTTELFNSPLKQSTAVTAPGGVVRWTPAGTLRDSTVYYWRTAFDSVGAGADRKWSTSSFVHMTGSSPGWNQSHYYQFRKDDFAGKEMAADRKWTYGAYGVRVKVLAKLVNADNEQNLSTISINEVVRQYILCPPYQQVIQIMVIDPVTGQPWANPSPLAPGATYNCRPQSGEVVFEYSLQNPTTRNNARRLLDTIPDGHFVIIKNNAFTYGPFANIYQHSPALGWKADTALAGPGKSLYHSLKAAGFNDIDNYVAAQPFYFVYQKGNAAFPKAGAVGADSLAAYTYETTLPLRLASGAVSSTVVGPAKAWNQLQWTATALDTVPQNDTMGMRIWGLPAGSSTPQLLWSGDARDTSLAWISANQYPRLQLEYWSKDTLTRTAPQLGYWRVLHTPAPEIAITPSALYSFSDSLEVGQMQELALAFENIGDQPMDSLLISYKVIDAGGVTHALEQRRYKPTNPGDTLHARLRFDAARFVGRNVLFVEANPNDDQPEGYHPNNLGYLPFRMDKDGKNPLIDVTFDGVRILDRDIVSPKPFIKVMLKDENRFLALNDTGLVQLYLRSPNDDLGTRRRIPFDATTCRFIPARYDGERLVNEAYIEYRPTFTERSATGDQHLFELSVVARDRTGNSAGPDYKIAFEVVYESSITRLLNYPNPFSTSTAFVFTLTGSEIPSQFKIQIMTVTGKVVREITRAELGPIHIGRNITEYKWDGRDQYGQLLGNGVYLYRVVTAGANGQAIEHRASGADKFFGKGWGKMYIMR